MQTRRSDHGLVGFADSVGDDAQVDSLLIRLVGNTDSPADVDELDADVQGVLDFNHQLEQHLGGIDKVVGVQLVGGDHGVQPEMLDPLVFHRAIALDELLLGESVLGFLGFPDDRVSLAKRAGIVAKAEKFRQPDVFFQIGDVTDVIQVDNCAQLLGFLILLIGGVIGGEHDVLSGKAYFFRENQLREGAAVGAESFLFEYFQDVGIRRGLDGEVFAKSRRPREKLFQFAGVLPNRLFIIDVKRSRVGCDNAFDLVLGKGNVLARHDLLPRFELGRRIEREITKVKGILDKI